MSGLAHIVSSTVQYDFSSDMLEQDMPDFVRPCQAFRA
jgi:hypothetical protein